MTTTTTDYLLNAQDISKHYGAVVALRSASLAVRPGEVHALMGANGAGKSTLVKILTGAVRPDAGTITVRGRERTAHSPAEARRGGLVSVYQEPALIPDLDILSNLRLTETPIEPFRHWLAELGLPDLDLSAMARGVPLAALRLIDLARALAIEPDVLMLDEMTAALPATLTETPIEPFRHWLAELRLPDLDLSAMARGVPLASLRIIDLARALAIEPDVLMLDEMTAALPANLTERVLEVLNQMRGGDRSVIFISHRMTEIGSVCDRATVLREGETVGIVDVGEGSAERIVELMLGEAVDQQEALAERHVVAPERRRHTPRVSVRNLSLNTRLSDVSFDLYEGEVLGVVALEGQGQDELFDVLSGWERPEGGEIYVNGNRV